MTVFDILSNSIHHINLVKIEYMKYFFLGLEDGFGKMKTKTYFVVFSNARSGLELMLCNQNLTELVYQTLLSSDCRALALKVSEHLKKKKIHQN